MESTLAIVAELNARRRALGRSVEEVARRAGIDEKSLAEWERGVGMPPLEAIQNWAAGLELKLALVAAQSELRQGLEIDWDRRCVRVDGSPVRLTPMEWKALERLAWTPGELVSHEALYRHLYGQGRADRAQSTAVRVLITKLRRLLPLRIDARWGRGYVISGVEPARAPEPPGEEPVPAPQLGEPAAVAPIIDCGRATLSRPAVRPMSPMRRNIIDLTTRASRPAAPQPSHLGLRRAEELGVIERFLAERGATRCPDVATIQHSPLPTLIWDKVKRKWVRPQLNEAS